MRHFNSVFLFSKFNAANFQSQSFGRGFHCHLMDTVDFLSFQRIDRTTWQQKALMKTDVLQCSLSLEKGLEKP